ncbi:hypothetical protein [Duganella vulcania]|uniref:Uncharacterized protein n=1 Tax=Duganella vulcania TaxID=2692166 RepID=A0A845GS54_9BURK|nr:hypothetical protein [Duganella vulcania]MYM96250.1 hypothetical protein [Duganella vulcania]
MEEKIKAALAGAFMLPVSVKSLLLEVGAELDQLRADVNQVKNQPPKE